MNRVLLSFGGNVGDPVRQFQIAEQSLEQGGFRIEKISRIYSGKAVGCEPGAPDFLNRSITGEWDGEPEELLNLIQAIEVRCGRPSEHPHWHSRTLDIDIILFGERSVSTPRLTIPHPLFREREFVMIPSAEIAPEMRDPVTGKKISDFLLEISEK